MASLFYFNKKIIYITEHAEWVIVRIGRYLTEYLKGLKDINAAIFDIVEQKRLSAFKNKILHFGSRSTFLPDNFNLVRKSNRCVFTWFHGMDEDTTYIDSLPEGSKAADFIHTSCSITRDQLIRWGAEEEKIVIIPIGVDLRIFTAVTIEDRKRMRNDLGIPEDHICIGSFQKDGVGWKDGNKPKLEKGPDIFCDVIDKLKKDYPLFVLLTGPARGYVKNRLNEIGVKFRHFYPDDFEEIPKYYSALDYYIVSSRVEGGPKAILECFASGIPFVTTEVGMVKDIVLNGENGLVSEVEDTNSIVNNFKSLVEDKSLRDRLVKNGLETAKSFDWREITIQYYDKIYSKLL